MQNTHADFIQVIHDYMSDPETDWRIGEQAIFARHKDEEVEISLDYAGGLIVTASGAVRIITTAMTRLVPAEDLTVDLWVQAGLLCLREGEADMAKRTVLTELGNDILAARPIGQLGTLFDLGLGDPNVDLCLRTADKGLCALLREREGTVFNGKDNALTDAIAEFGVDYVAVSRLGRIESFGCRSIPEKSLGLRAPAGYEICMSFEPPRPQPDEPFDEATYGAFRVLYGIFGDPEIVRLKQDLSDALRDGAEPETIPAKSLEARTAVAILLRQLTIRDGCSEILNRWQAAFDL